MSEEKRGMLSAGHGNVRKSATLASLSDKGPTVRVNFDLDRDEHKRLKMMAVEQGERSLKSYVSLCLNHSN